MYLHQDDEIAINSLDHIIKQLSTPFIISGDFNSHNIIWGSTFTNSRGKNIENIIDKHNLILLNNGNNTHFNSYNGNQSAIDLTICDSSLAPYISWNTFSDLFGSDHFPIEILIEGFEVSQINQEIRKFPTWRMNEADWDTFSQTVNIQIPENVTDINKINKIITDEIITTASLCIPKNNTVIKRKQTVWWNKECEKAIKQKNQLLSRAKRHPSEENLKNFKVSRAKCRFIIREAKKQSWIKFSSSFNSSTPIKEVWNKVKMLKNQNFTAITVIKKDSQITHHKQEIAEIIADHFYNISATKNYSPTFINLKQSAEEKEINYTDSSHEDYNRPFTLDELIFSLKNMKSSAAGPDSIHIDMIKKLNVASLEELLKFYNLLWKIGKIPVSWKSSHIIPLPKPEKDPHYPTNLRPISLTNTLCKIMEKIVNYRLKWFFEKNQLLDKMQFGFRSKRNTIDQLTKLQQQISDGFVTDQFTTLVSFDLEKAFDKLWKYKILEMLETWNIKGNMFAFIQDFLRDRIFQVRIQDVLSSAYTQENGIPQGSVISPTLFIIGITGIAQIINPPVNYGVFADDLVIYITSSNLQSQTSILQKTTNNLKKWAEKNGLAFSPTKTKIITFSNKRINPPECRINLNNISIQNTQYLKYLGLIIDRKLSWNRHIEKLKMICHRSLNVIKMVAHSRWGGDRKIIKNLYTALVLSKLDYGSIIYNSAKPNLLKKLDTIQHTGLRLISGAMYTSPISSLHAETCILPLQYRRKILSLTYYSKLSLKPLNPAYKRTINPFFTDLYEKKHAIPKPVGVRCKNLLLSIPQFSFIATDLEDSDPPWNQTIETHKKISNQAKKLDDKMKSYYRCIFLKKWQHQWKQEGLSQSNKLYTIKNKISDWKSSYRSNRQEETVLAKLRIGHSQLTHSHIFRREPAPLCDSCKELLTINHVLTKCRKFESQRINLNLQGRSIADMLKDEEKSCETLFKYLRAISLYNKI